MEEIAVRITRLEPMRVASTYGFGNNPEEEAWKRMVAWAGPKGFLDDPAVHPIFGLNNPYPTPENPRYGYEFWIKVSPDVEPDGDVRIGEFLGGSYAVTRCEARGEPEKNIPSRWRALADWCREHHHALGSHQALEGFLTSPGDPAGLVMDLYCPIIP